jgi:hypothetical protein
MVVGRIINLGSCQEAVGSRACHNFLQRQHVRHASSPLRASRDMSRASDDNMCLRVVFSTNTATSRPLERERSWLGGTLTSPKRCRVIRTTPRWRPLDRGTAALLYC